jgi:hypothetical protein
VSLGEIRVEAQSLGKMGSGLLEAMASPSGASENPMKLGPVVHPLLAVGAG